MIGTEEFDKYCTLAKKHEIRKLKLGDVEIEFNTPTRVTFDTPSDLKTLTDVSGMPSDDQMMTWSADSQLEDKNGN